MMERRRFLLAILALAASPAAGQTRAVDLVLSGPEFDMALLAAANAHRSAHGLAAFRPHARLTRAASAQTVLMAQARMMEHEIPGQPGFAQRLRAAGARPRRAGENILRSHLSRHGAGCGQATPAFMAALTGELAEESLRRWIGSPKHRANLLDPRFGRIGGAYAVVAAPDACGQIYVAQVLSS